MSTYKERCKVRQARMNTRRARCQERKITRLENCSYAPEKHMSFSKALAYAMAQEKEGTLSSYEQEVLSRMRALCEDIENDKQVTQDRQAPTKQTVKPTKQTPRAKEPVNYLAMPVKDLWKLLRGNNT